MLSVHGVDVDPETRRVWREGSEIRLSKKEFELLYALIRRPGEIVSREQLMLEVWNTTFWTSAKTIDVHLGWLRRKLGDDTRRPTLITTIRGRGLRFEPDGPRRGGGLQGELTRRLGSAPCPATPVLAVIGGGQLARMMAQSAVGLGLPLRLLSEAEGSSAMQVVPDTIVGDYRDLETLRRVAEGCAVVTFDHEHVPPAAPRDPRRRGACLPSRARPRSCTPRTRA